VYVCSDRAIFAVNRQRDEDIRVFGDWQVIGKDHAMLSMAAALLCVSPFLSVDVTMEYLESCIYLPLTGREMRISGFSVIGR
jgi:hypothetical protein